MSDYDDRRAEGKEEDACRRRRRTARKRARVNSATQAPPEHLCGFCYQDPCGCPPCDI